MDPLGGLQSVDRLKASGNDDAQMYVAEGAGHHGQLHRFRLRILMLLTCFVIL